MSYLYLLDQVVARLARPFAKADSWSEYASRAYWRLGAVALGGLILILIASGYFGGPLSTAPSNITSSLDSFSDQFRPISLLKTLPWAIGLGVIYLTIGLVPKFRGIRDFIGAGLANSFYRFTEGVIGSGEWCIRHRGGSMLIIGLLAFVVGWAATGFFTTKGNNALLEQGLGRWLAEAERFVIEEPLFSQKEGRLKDLEELWQDNYKGILLKRGGYTHDAAHLHDAIRLLDMPKDNGDAYNVYLYKRMEDFKDDSGNTVQGFKSIAGKCSSQPPRHAATSEIEERACDLVNLLLAKLHSRFADSDDVFKYLKQVDGSYANQEVQDEKRLAFLKDCKTYYAKVNPSSYMHAAWKKRHLFSVYNGTGNVYSGMLGYLKKHNWEVGDAPCTKVSECVRLALKAYDEAETNLQPTQNEVQATERYSRLGGKLANNRIDLHVRLAMDYDEIYKRLDKETREKAHMEDRAALEQYIEKNIVQITTHNSAEGDTLRDSAVTIAQAYGASIGLKGATAQGAPQPANGQPANGLLTREQLAKAAGLYLRIVNSFEPKNYSDWGPTYFCNIVRDPALVSAFGCAATDAALSGMPELNLDELLGEIRTSCGVKLSPEELKQLAEKSKCGQ